MLSNLCHLSLISHSKSSFSIISDQLEAYNALQKFSKSFNHASFKNFSLFNLINQNSKTLLYAVSQNDTIIHIDTETMELEKIFRKNGCPYSFIHECDDSVTINFLSEINLLNHKMLWFCYILHNKIFPSTSQANCLVPKNDILPTDMTWTKEGYSSNSIFFQTFTVITNSYIFIGSYVKNSLLILRTKLPNVLGKIDSTQDLMTPRAEFYFEKKSKFHIGFATKYEVYYVVVEPINAKSHSIPECLSSTDTRNVLSTRLIKICKDDPGGVPQYNEKNFGTTAKAEIICPIGFGQYQYHYTNSISASWSGDKLYILFESQKNSPTGKVLCVYNEIAFNIAFNSDMRPPIIFENLDKNQRLDNPVEEICKKLTENRLNDKEKIEATSMSANGLYRSKNIMPISASPLLNLRNYRFNSITTFKLSKFDTTTVIVLSSRNSIKILSHMNDLNVCLIQDFQLENHEEINQIKGINIKTKVFVYISTNTRIIQLELKMCQEYQTRIQCLTNAPSICGWDSRRGRCNFLREDIDLSRWERSSCKNFKTDDNKWNVDEKCNIKNGKEIYVCICTYCLNEAACSGEKQVQVKNCSGSYGEWSPWSECSQIFQHQKRTRVCTANTCVGPSIDYKKCENMSPSEIVTNWTNWYKSDNNKYLISYRAKCPIDNQFPPIIEKREIPCDKTCRDDNFKWSSWSECTETNIQYRLLNCSTLDECPHSRTEIKQCSPSFRKYQQQSGEKNSGYSIIHIVLSILVVSLIWLLLLILVIILIFRYNFISKSKSKKRGKQSKIPLKRMSTTHSPQILNQQMLMFSEISNEYLSSDNQSLPYNLNNVSFTSSIDRDRAPPHFRNFYAPIPFTSDNHPIIRDN